MTATAQKLTTYARYCTACACVDACRSAFGAFWPDRSGGGVGCNKPFDGKGRLLVPPPARREMAPEHLVAWVEEFSRRVAEEHEGLKDLTPQELDVNVHAIYGDRLPRKYK